LASNYLNSVDSGQSTCVRHGILARPHKDDARIEHLRRKRRRRGKEEEEEEEERESMDVNHL
jgi:hypothetical protein